MVPSVKTLESAFPGKGKELRALISGKVSPDRYESVRKWAAECYHKPSYIERVMCAADEIIGGYGCEAIFGERITWPDIEYVNLGDSYTTTLIYDRLKERFIVGSWGDWIESRERRGFHYA